MSLLRKIKSLVPSPIVAQYHHALAGIAEVVYRHPSDEMIVVGVTGTSGKSSTVSFLAQILTTLGYTVGYTSTAGFNIAGKDTVNAMKMTMPGRFTLQRLLRSMVDAKCTVAIVETSSQGLIQYRHVGVNYDVALFTKLTPEHIEAHGGFENYKKAKGILFKHLTARSKKTVGGKLIPKVNVVNTDDEHAAYYASFRADRRIGFGFSGTPGTDQLVAYVEHHDRERGVTLSVNGVETSLSLMADFEHKNALAAVAGAVAIGVPLADAMRAAALLHSVPGRFESIEAGQPFMVIVDFAFEPFALQALYRSLPPGRTGRIIGVHGSTGGGRDAARRVEIGRLAAQNEDIVIVTNEDPYDEDPRVIIDAVAAGARTHGKIDDETLFVIDDRREAIEKAMHIARTGDIVLITGKGSEPVMVVASGKIPWDDRDEARRALAKSGYSVL